MNDTFPFIKFFSEQKCISFFLGERKQKDVEGKLQIYKDMYMEQKKKAQKEATDETELKEKCAKTEKDLEIEKQPFTAYLYF